MAVLSCCVYLALYLCLWSSVIFSYLILLLIFITTFMFQSRVSLAVTKFMCKSHKCEMAPVSRHLLCLVIELKMAMNTSEEH